MIVCVIKKKKWPLYNRHVIEMQKCEVYNTIKQFGQGYEVGMVGNAVYDEVNAFYDACN